MNVTFDHAINESEQISTFYFQPEKPVDYIAGQFVELTLPHDNPDSRGISRWFSLTSSPTEDMLAITSKFTKQGQESSFKHALRTLEPDHLFHMSDPMGDFVLPKDAQTPLVFVANGIGITPFRSMFKWLADTKGEPRMIKFIYGVKTEEEILFQNEIHDAGVHATIVVEEPSAAWGGERGSVTADMVIGLEAPTPETLIYMSGPEIMIEALRNDLLEKGISRAQIVTDYFPGYTKL